MACPSKCSFLYRPHILIPPPLHLVHSATVPQSPVPLPHCLFSTPSLLFIFSLSHPCSHFHINTIYTVLNTVLWSRWYFKCRVPESVCQFLLIKGEFGGEGCKGVLNRLNKIQSSRSCRGLQKTGVTTVLLCRLRACISVCISRYVNLYPELVLPYGLF